MIKSGTYIVLCDSSVSAVTAGTGGVVLQQPKKQPASPARAFRVRLMGRSAPLTVPEAHFVVAAAQDGDPRFPSLADAARISEILNGSNDDD